MQQVLHGADKLKRGRVAIRTPGRSRYGEAAQLTTNDVRNVPAEPHETTIPQRPGVVRVPTFHVQLIRPLTGRFE
jgi:hypothetical protein